MEEDSRTLETKSVGMVDENREENELTLELSIGGIFGKSEKLNRSVNESVERGDLNVQSKREFQAHRRRELRRKREDKLKKLVGFDSCGSVNGPFVENKEWLEKQIVGNNGEILETEPARKRERIGNLPENVGLDPTAPITNDIVNQKTMPVCGGGQVAAQTDEDMKEKNSVLRPTACRSFRPYQGEGGGRRNCIVNSNASAGCGSSAYSDGQCSSHQDGDTDGSRSNSCNSQLDQDHQLATTSTTTDPFDPSDQQPINASKQTKNLTDSTTSEPCPTNPNNQSNLNPETSNSHNQQASFLARMPCVSTTGNGPNGKTVSGFLYRYTKNEVSIVCVCHGHLFSPAGFVEHAGGVDIVHPLKHITIFPTAFAS